MTSEREQPKQDTPASPSRRAALRAASALVASAALQRAHAQTPAGTAGTPPTIPGFTPARIATGGGITIHAVKGGSGPPLLLLHGAPLTHYTWRDVAPALAEQYTVIATDLRGYGQSSKPVGLPGHSNYSKRAMAEDQVEVMQQFGFERFAVVGQDRGGRVAHRMALDHPRRVTKAVFIDIVPTHYLYTHFSIEFVQAYFHWFSYLRAAPVPENELLAQAAARAAQLSPTQAGYQITNGTPEGVHGMCEDYRAGASIDLADDAADLNRKIRCPLNVLWAENGAMDTLYDVLPIWRERADDVVGKGMPGGHNMQEGAPRELLAEIQSFLHA